MTRKYGRTFTVFLAYFAYNFYQFLNFTLHVSAFFFSNFPAAASKTFCCKSKPWAQFLKVKRVIRLSLLPYFEYCNSSPSNPDFIPCELNVSKVNNSLHPKFESKLSARCCSRKRNTKGQTFEKRGYCVIS